jgi:hypothetical protein
MTSTRRRRSTQPSEAEPFRPIQYTSDVFPIERVNIESGPTGPRRRRRQRGRYHPRPRPRRRTDLLGFNAMWWLVIVIVVVLALSF